MIKSLLDNWVTKHVLKLTSSQFPYLRNGDKMGDVFLPRATGETQENAATVPGVRHVQGAPSSYTPGKVLLLKLCKLLVPGGDLAVTTGLHFDNLALVSFANLRVGGAKSTGPGRRPPESKPQSCS